MHNAKQILTWAILALAVATAGGCACAKIGDSWYVRVGMDAKLDGLDYEDVGAQGAKTSLRVNSLNSQVNQGLIDIAKNLSAAAGAAGAIVK